MTYAQVSACIPEQGTDAEVKTFILTSIEKGGSGFTHDEIKQLYWGNSWKPHKITRSDDLLLQQLMYANTSAALQAAKSLLLNWGATTERAIARKEELVSGILDRNNGFSKEEWENYSNQLISTMQTPQAKQQLRALLLGTKESFHHGYQGMLKKV